MIDILFLLAMGFLAGFTFAENRNTNFRKRYFHLRRLFFDYMFEFKEYTDLPEHIEDEAHEFLKEKLQEMEGELYNG